MKERWQKISALALAAALTLLGGVQVFADGEQAPLTIGQSGPQPVLLMAASAETGTDGLQYSYHTDNTATVSGYTGAATELVIPAEVTHEGETYKVTAIGGYAFQGKSTLTRVTNPEGVTTIEGYAFFVFTLIEHFFQSSFAQIRRVIFFKIVLHHSSTSLKILLALFKRDFTVPSGIFSAAAAVRISMS